MRLQENLPPLIFQFPLTSSLCGQRATYIEVVSSQALIKKRSQLYVRFNNATIGQIAFDPDRPSLVSEIAIPFIVASRV